MIGMRHLGISAVIAESFSPGYWRGEVAMGFPQIACPDILKFVNRWDVIEVDWAAHKIKNHTRHDQIDFEVWSESDQLMIESGGVLGYLKHIKQEESR
jgi:3-isopropylmalate/(R)-2-methylmalate dehydratase small subunit